MGAMILPITRRDWASWPVGTCSFIHLGSSSEPQSWTSDWSSLSHMSIANPIPEATRDMKGEILLGNSEGQPSGGSVLSHHQAGPGTPRQAPHEPHPQGSHWRLAGPTSRAFLSQPASQVGPSGDSRAGRPRPPPCPPFCCCSASRGGGCQFSAPCPGGRREEKGREGEER